MDKKMQEYDFNNLKQDLHDQLELSQISVSEELIQRTLKAANSATSPHISKWQQKKKRQKSVQWMLRAAKSTIAVAAVFAIVFLYSSLHQNSKKSADQSIAPVDAGTTEDVATLDAAAETMVGQESELEEGNSTYGESTNGQERSFDSEQGYLNLLEELFGQAKEIEVSKADNGEILQKTTDQEAIQRYYEVLKNYDMMYQQANLDSWEYKIIIKDQTNYTEIYVWEGILYGILNRNDSKQTVSYQIADYDAFIQALMHVVDAE